MMRRNRLVLVAGVLACAVLGMLFHASRQRGASMREQLATLRQATPAKPMTSGAGTAATTTAARTDSRELAEWAALLEAARRVPEVARREAALRIIKRIQAAHAANPPPPRPVPPPTPRDAMFFAELLDDPEYLQLVAQGWRRAQGLRIERQLERLGLPEAARNKVVELEFESYTAGLDVQRYSRDDAAARDAAIAATRKLRAENDAAIRQILGEEAHAAYYRDHAPTHLAPSRIPDSVLEPLAMRLSYSAAPLAPATRAQLAELLQSMSASGSVYTMSRTPEFIERARSVLQPAQVAALEELRAEYEAARARARLPKSSELPRTARRQRLDAGSN